MRALLVISAVLAFGCAEERKTIGPFKFQELVNRCLAKGGSPIPIYDKNDPVKVFEVQCQIKAG